ncbi:nickel ABC transporter permease [Desulfosporosinus sp. BICA1-9]|uniref:nickel ABC transporter permease n=1 Tax=Desulfosporosinus sp. BICA1-9 TaxID=1531958 RepID=UPI00054C19A2|nr:nickel ABC transporter permease [Desulfosporosinus sp. BICA1-9]KJS48612.1 MAG: hypothetical protein VR66_13045 [Peptococcaceae bacterium BRH_c23]KJS81511.1 MAG: hypothetical protein JL57_26440 [Desulfosporosinus sp. BICA1-9]HBW35208.1 ABC transporter permease [Desulfosporosinus sp.]
MLRFIIKRAFSLILILLAISIITFTLTHLSAGDAASIIARDNGGQQTEEAVKIIRTELGLDQPLTVQYGNWLKSVLKGDLGTSYKSKRPILDELIVRFPATLKLALCAMALLLLIALPLGILSAMYPESWLDRLGRNFSFLSVSMPSFWLGLLLLYIFGARLKWIPVVGNSSSNTIILPAVTLALGHVGPYIRLLRTSMLDVLGKEYIKALRAKGLLERYVIGKHALKNAILPIITQMGMAFGGLLGGSFIVESIFSWQGLGKYALDSIGYKDLPAIQGYVLMMAVVIVGINLLVDILYVYIDPRIKLN